MFTGGICPERSELLRQLERALNEHTVILGKLHTVAGTGHPDLFRILARQAEESSAVVRAAMHDYLSHMETHRCKLESSPPPRVPGSSAAV
jgi:hypothetical protein